MYFPQLLQQIVIEDERVAIYAPDEEVVKQNYNHNKQDAYWARVWPAAIGLCRFLKEHPVYIVNKTVLELAAGLGLPGIFGARWAKKVMITDREPAAALFVQRSVQHLQLSNISTATLDWKNVRSHPLPEVVLLSDVNYEPGVFEELFQTLYFLLEKGTVIIISTPQRLAAKLFIERLLPFKKDQWNCKVRHSNAETGVSVFVLGGSGA